MGSGLRPDVWRSFLQRFGAIRIVETYGMTEGNVTLFNYTGTPGAVGRSSFIYKVRRELREPCRACVPPLSGS